MKKILLLGLTSNIGYGFYKKYKNIFNIVATYRNFPFEDSNFIKLIDYSKKSLEILIFSVKPDIIINTLSEGNIDKCENISSKANFLNVLIVKNIVDIIKNKSILLVNFSSSAIYDGNYPYYAEHDKALPINKYGKYKVEADDIVRKNLKKYLILRPTTILGFTEAFQRENLGTSIIKSFSKNINIKLLDDYCVNFIYIDDLIEIIAYLIKNNITGEFNLSGNETLSGYELGLEIYRKIKTKSIITKYYLSDFNSVAKRPKNTSLNNLKIKKLINFELLSIDAMISKMLKDNSYSLK